MAFRGTNVYSNGDARAYGDAHANGDWNANSHRYADGYANSDIHPNTCTHSRVVGQRSIVTVCMPSSVVFVWIPSETQ